MLYDYRHDNDYEDENDNDNEYGEYSDDIIKENLMDYKLSIILKYKEVLCKEPEFIGIKNICCAEILDIIESNSSDTNNRSNTNNEIKLNNKDYILNYDQLIIFKRMYDELNLEYNIDTFNIVTKKIFKRVYF